MIGLPKGDSDRESKWKNEFKNIVTSKDAARFTTRAKLKIYSQR